MQLLLCYALPCARCTLFSSTSCARFVRREAVDCRAGPVAHHPRRDHEPCPPPHRLRATRNIRGRFVLGAVVDGRYCFDLPAPPRVVFFLFFFIFLPRPQHACRRPDFRGGAWRAGRAAGVAARSDTKPRWRRGHRGQVHAVTLPAPSSPALARPAPPTRINPRHDSFSPPPGPIQPVRNRTLARGLLGRVAASRPPVGPP